MTSRFRPDHPSLDEYGDANNNIAKEWKPIDSTDAYSSDCYAFLRHLLPELLANIGYVVEKRMGRDKDGFPIGFIYRLRKIEQK